MRAALASLALALLSCSKAPVACDTVDARAGTTTDIFSFEKGTMTVELTGCSDESRRVIACRTATSGGYKCECTIHKKNGTYAARELRTEEALTAENAREFARNRCQWEMK